VLDVFKNLYGGIIFNVGFGETLVVGETVGVNVKDGVVIGLTEMVSSFSFSDSSSFIWVTKGVIVTSVLTALLFLEIKRE